MSASNLLLAALLASALLAATGSVTSSPAAPIVSQNLDQLSDVQLVARLPAPGEYWKLHETLTRQEWVLHPVAAELRRRAEEGQLSEDGWQAAVRATVLHTRDSWPQGVPLEVWIREPEWIGGIRITLVATQPELGTIVADHSYQDSCATSALSSAKARQHLALGAMKATTRSVMFDADIEQALEAKKRPKQMRSLWKGSLSLPVTCVESVEECLPSSSGVELQEWVRRSLSLTANGLGPVLCVDTCLAEDPTFSRVGVSLEVEILRAGEVVERLQVVADQYGDLQRDPGTRLWGGAQVESLPLEHQLQANELDAWQVRVRGTWTGLLSLWEAERWWKGEFTVPLQELLERGR